MRRKVRVLKHLKCGFACLLLCAVLFCGCSDKKAASGLPGQYWETAEYTMEEINAKYRLGLCNDERIRKADDVSEDALRAYNILLGYAERVIGTDYYVYDYYYADWTDPPHSWLIKIVPYEMAEIADDEERGLYIDEPVTLIFKEDGSKVNSTIEPYLMEKKWFAELENEMSESFPEYEIELEISEFEHLYPDILRDKFADPSDYGYLINENFYDNLSEWEYGNIINVRLPEGTEQSGAAKAFERIKPTLAGYCVTEVRMFAVTDGEYSEWTEIFTIDG